MKDRRKATQRVDHEGGTRGTPSAAFTSSIDGSANFLRQFFVAHARAPERVTGREGVEIKFLGSDDCQGASERVSSNVEGVLPCISL